MNRFSGVLKVVAPLLALTCATAVAQVTVFIDINGGASGFSNPTGSNYWVVNSSYEDTVYWGTSTGLGRNELTVAVTNLGSQAVPSTGLDVGDIFYLNTHTTGGVLKTVDYALKMDVVARENGTDTYLGKVDFSWRFTISTTPDPGTNTPLAGDFIRFEPLGSLTQVISPSRSNDSYSFSLLFGNPGGFLSVAGQNYEVDESYKYRTLCRWVTDWGYDIADLTLGVSVSNNIPEPSTYAALLGLGALGLVVGRRTLRKRSA
jgi:hypothetical protein